MHRQVKGFLKYLIIEKNASPRTIVKYRSDLGYLCSYLLEHFNISDPDFVKINHLRDYLGYVRDLKSLKVSSISSKIAVFKSFFRYIHDSKIIGDNPTLFLRSPRIPRPVPKYLNDIELEKLLSAPDRLKSKRLKKFMIRDKLILTTFAYAGIRKSELLNLNWDDINLGTGYLIIRNSKNKTDRAIPLHKNITRLLDFYLSERLPLTTSALFVGERGRRLTPSSLVRLFDRYLNMSGLSSKGYTIHSLRHTFATRLLRKDVSLVKIKNLLGHRTVRSTEIYLHTTGKELADSINLL
jgi:site-specific recombinase XerD